MARKKPKKGTRPPVAPGVITRYLATHYACLSPGAPIQNGHLLHLYSSAEKRTVAGTIKRVKAVHGGRFGTYTIKRIVTILRKFTRLTGEKNFRKFRAFLEEYIHISKYLAIKIEPEPLSLHDTSPGTESGNHDSGQRDSLEITSSNCKTNLIRNAANMSTGNGSPPLHPMIASLSWLLGKWRTEEGFGHYPTMKDFQYIEELDFSHVGQPNIQFAFYAFNVETKKPMHREVGFIRIHPETKKIAFMSAQNIGVSEVEEGELTAPQELTLHSHTMGRMTFGKEPGVTELKRTFKMVGDELEQIVSMATLTTPMTEHLRSRYKKWHHVTRQYTSTMLS